MQEALAQVKRQAYASFMDAYTHALAWLSRRELTERQVRQRLTRRAVTVEEIDAAIDRLRREGALDDRRVAGAYARTAVRLKGRGPLRLRRDLQALGIGDAAAHEAIGDALADTPEDVLIDRALDRRWPRSGEVDRPTLARLYRALLRQGFSAEKTMAALKRRGQTVDEGSD